MGKGFSLPFFVFKKGNTMYRADAIKKALIGLIGWRQHYNIGDFSIKEELTKSETGQYYQDMHPLLTLENIKSVAPDYLNNIPEWRMQEKYKENALTLQNDTVYMAKSENTGKDPEQNSDLWEVKDTFSEWLKEKTEASIMKVMETFYSAQLQDRTAKNILESKVLFDGAGRLTDQVRNTNSMVGLEIIPIRAQGVTLKIEKVGLQFSRNGHIKLYLMHTSSPTPIKTKEIDYNKNGGMQWEQMDDLYLPYMSDETDAGGSWFLCYNQNELQEGMNAIQKNRDWSKGPCISCSRAEYNSWQAWSRFLEIHPFKVQAPGTDEMWDVEQNLYTYQTNYGLNLKVTMVCDLTDIIIEQRQAFQNAIGLQVAADMIREFAYNPNFRLNRTQQNFSRNELLYELDGDSQGYKKSGILYRLDQAMKALQIDTAGINRICLPCNNGGIRYMAT